MNTIIKLLINGFAVYATALIVPGARISGFLAAILAGFLLAVVNTFIKPLLVLLTLPLSIITLGLFIFVINTLLILLVEWLVPGFDLGGFWNALLFGIVLTVVKFLIDLVF